jgi:peptidoglycan-associated lipoprotein
VVGLAQDEEGGDAVRRRSLGATLSTVLLLAAFVAACKKPPVTTPTEAPPPPPAPKPVEAPAPQEITETFKPAPVETAPVAEPSIEELNRSGVLRTIYFAFDRADLTEESRATLRANAEWLKANPKYRIRIEGHCDERGTIEYNLALGQRRADAARDYLVSLGVDPGRLTTISYGEERPADPGHNEEAWAKNRRAEFVIEG